MSGATTRPSVAAWEDARAAFLFAHDLLRTPSVEQHSWLRSSSTQRMWARLVELLRPHQDNGRLPRRLELPASCHTYEEQYVAAFEVGLPHAPVPLIESHHRRGEPVPRVLHENILFHRAFGLQIKEDSLESSDHLRYQLELLARLCELGAKAEARDDREQLEQIERALDDFGSRHLETWLGSATEKAENLQAEWVPSMLGLVRALVGGILALTSSPVEHEQSPAGNAGRRTDS